jgi:AcrR family transcriptional regulator
MASRAVASVRPAVPTRDLILDAAERRFAEHGLAGVSMREIATEAGVRNQASLYHYFRDKETLYEAVLARGIGPIVALVAQGHPAAAGVGGGAMLTPDTVDGVLDRILDYLETHPHLPRLIQRAALDDTRPLEGPLTRLLRPLYTQGLRVLAGGGTPPAALPHLAAGLYHLIFGYFADAALLRAVMGDDLGRAGGLAEHRRFVKRAVATLLGMAPDAPPPPPAATRRETRA